MPRPSGVLRLLAFALPALLGLTGVQPLVASSVGALPLRWSLTLALPTLAAAGGIHVAARLTDRGDSRQPPWYSAWVLLPGSFLLTGAAAMCVLAALTAYPPTQRACWELLGGGIALWAGGLAWVRYASA